MRCKLLSQRCCWRDAAATQRMPASGWQPRQVCRHIPSFHPAFFELICQHCGALRRLVYAPAPPVAPRVILVYIITSGAANAPYDAQHLAAVIQVRACHPTLCWPRAVVFMRLCTGYAADDEGFPVACRMHLVPVAASRPRPGCNCHLQSARCSVLKLSGHNGTVRLLLQPDFSSVCAINAPRRYWPQQQICGRKGVNLTPELYIIKSLLGAIDPMYDNLD